MSALPPLHGHEAVRASLARAVRDNALPGSLLLHGPAGIGRQRLGLWLAQLLTCAEPTEDGPCGRCASCRFAVRLEHPDIHWFFPLPRPRVSGGPERLADALEEGRAAEIEARRATPLRPVGGGSEILGFYLAQVQTMRRIAQARPAMAARKVFLIGDAELLVPQESSPEAANAMLKLLEEPPPATTFILTAAEPDALLPTLRSRLLPVRLRPLPIDDVAAFLAGALSIPIDDARLPARLAQGSIGRALAFMPAEGEPGPLEALRRQARSLLEAVTADSPLPRIAAAHATPPTGARGAFTELLDAFALWLRDLAVVATGEESMVVNADALGLLRNTAGRFPRAGERVHDAIRLVDEARALTQNNVNPQLLLATLLRRIQATLKGEA